MEKLSETIYCAFCRLPRKVYLKKHVTWTNVLLSFCLAVVVAGVVSQVFDPLVLVLFVVFLCGAEIFILIRRRMSIPCPHCCFDPHVYLRNPREAALRVKTHLDQLKSSGDWMLKQNNPFSRLPKGPPPPKKSEDPHLLSRRA